MVILFYITGASWDGFNAALTTSKPNLEHMGLYFFEPEITPTLSKSVVARFKCEESEPNSFSKFTPCALFSVEEEVRSLIESQIMNMKYHVEKIGLKTPSLFYSTSFYYSRENYCYRWCISKYEYNSGDIGCFWCTSLSL